MKVKAMFANTPEKYRVALRTFCSLYSFCFARVAFRLRRTPASEVACGQNFPDITAV